MALFAGLPRWVSTRKVKPIWILPKQETVSGSGISWAICKRAPRSTQITMPALHHSGFLQAGCPSCRPTNSVKALKMLAKTFAKLLYTYLCYYCAVYLHVSMRIRWLICWTNGVSSEHGFSENRVFFTEAIMLKWVLYFCVQASESPCKGGVPFLKSQWIEKTGSSSGWLSEVYVSTLSSFQFFVVVWPQ